MTGQRWAPSTPFPRCAMPHPAGSRIWAWGWSGRVGWSDGSGRPDYRHPGVPGTPAHPLRPGDHLAVPDLQPAAAAAVAGSLALARFPIGPIRYLPRRVGDDKYRSVM